MFYYINHHNFFYLCKIHIFRLNNIHYNLMDILNIFFLVYNNNNLLYNYILLLFYHIFYLHYDNFYHILLYNLYQNIQVHNLIHCFVFDKGFLKLFLWEKVKGLKIEISFFFFVDYLEFIL